MGETGFDFEGRSREEMMWLRKANAACALCLHFGIWRGVVDLETKNIKPWLQTCGLEVQWSVASKLLVWASANLCYAAFASSSKEFSTVKHSRDVGPRRCNIFFGLIL